MEHYIQEDIDIRLKMDRMRYEVLNIDFDTYIADDGKRKLQALIDNQDCKEMIEFILDKSKPDRNYKVKYEEESEFYQSINNEIFDIVLENSVEFEVQIESFINNVLCLSVI